MDAADMVDDLYMNKTHCGSKIGPLGKPLARKHSHTLGWTNGVAVYVRLTPFLVGIGPLPVILKLHLRVIQGALWSPLRVPACVKRESGVLAGKQQGAAVQGINEGRGLGCVVMAVAVLQQRHDHCKEWRRGGGVIVL